MTDVERDLRDMMQRQADALRHAPRASGRLVRRARVRRARTVAIAGAAAVTLVIGGFAGVRSLSRDEAVPANPGPKETTGSSGGMWPQSGLEEVRQAQELVDAGDPRYNWQLFPEWPPYEETAEPGLMKPAIEPGEVELFTRFLQQKLGWEEFSWGVGPGSAPPENWPYQFVVVRCAPGETNALYPNDPDGRECAPTLDDDRYETVRISARAFFDVSGIWVVTRWEMLPPTDEPVTGLDLFRHQIQQVEPPSEAKAAEFLRTFLKARVDGEGAEQYTNRDPGPLLYASTSGARYERSEVELVRGPVWPTGWLEFNVRLFAEDGTTEVEQLFVDREADGRLVVSAISSSDDETLYGEI